MIATMLLGCCQIGNGNLVGLQERQKQQLLLIMTMHGGQHGPIAVKYVLPMIVRVLKMVQQV